MTEQLDNYVAKFIKKNYAILFVPPLYNCASMETQSLLHRTHLEQIS